MTVTGCLPDYKLGISFPLWIAYYTLCLIGGLKLFSNFKKARLVNQRELYLTCAIFFTFQSTIGMMMFHLGVIFIGYFNLFTNTGWVITSTMTLPYIYSWEKNTVNMKKIPAMTYVIQSILSILNLVVFLFTGTVPELLMTLFAIMVILPVVPFIYILLKFVSLVVGEVRRYGIIFLLAISMVMVAAFLDHPPGCMNTLSSILSPVLFLFGAIFNIIAILRLIDLIPDFYSQAGMCTVHRGMIGHGQHRYYCPSCNTIYCMQCHDLVIKKDGCWNCGEGGAVDGKEKREAGPTLKLEESSESRKKIHKS